MRLGIWARHYLMRAEMESLTLPLGHHTHPENYHLVMIRVGNDIKSIKTAMT
jgi:hypothetical protein